MDYWPSATRTAEFGTWRENSRPALAASRRTGSSDTCTSCAGVTRSRPRFHPAFRRCSASALCSMSTSVFVSSMLRCNAAICAVRARLALAVSEIWWRIHTVPRPMEPPKQIVTSTQTRIWFTKACVSFLFMAEADAGEEVGEQGLGTSQLAQDAKLGGATAGIGGQLGVAGSDRLAGERIGELHTQVLRRGVVGALGLAAHAAKKLLHRAILQRVEADHREHAA